MRVRTLCTVKRGGVYHPPGTAFDDLDEADLKALRGRVVVVHDLDEAPAEISPPDGDEDAPPTIDDVPPVVPVVEAVEPAPSPSAPTSAEDPQGAGSQPEDAERIGVISRAIDTLDEADFTLAGRPKVDALKAALGFAPSRDEVDAAIALRDSMNG